MQTPATVKEPIPFTEEDQKNINLFSRTIIKKKAYEEDIAQLTLNNLEDAQTELELIDENETPEVPYRIGGMFAMLSINDAQDNLAKEKEHAQELIEKHKQKIKKYEERIKTLKTVLYGRLGDTIMLD